MRIDPLLKHNFTKLCDAEKMSMADVIQAWMEECVEKKELLIPKPIQQQTERRLSEICDRLSGLENQIARLIPESDEAIVTEIEPEFEPEPEPESLAEQKEVTLAEFCQIVETSESNIEEEFLSKEDFKDTGSEIRKSFRYQAKKFDPEGRAWDYNPETGNFFFNQV